VTRRTESVVSWIVMAILAVVAAVILVVQADYDPAVFATETTAARPVPARATPTPAENAP
jgi:hypothetical protein